MTEDAEALRSWFQLRWEHSRVMSDLKGKCQGVEAVTPRETKVTELKGKSECE